MKALVFVCFMMLGIMANAQNGYQVGELATDFSLKDTKGSNVALANYKDAKGFIIVFTCNTRPVAQAYQSRIEALNASFAAKGYPVIAINTNDPISSPGDSYAKMQAYAKEKNFSYPYLVDPDHIYTRKYGAQRTPHVFVLKKTDKGNEVAYIGAIDNTQEEVGPSTVNYVANAVHSLLQGQKPNISTTKAIGCGIKWKKEGAE